MTNLLCRNEEELKKMKFAAIAAAEQWVDPVQTVKNGLARPRLQ